jgi:hypothetical protein
MRRDCFDFYAQFFPGIFFLELRQHLDPIIGRLHNTARFESAAGLKEPLIVPSTEGDSRALGSMKVA